MFANILTVPKKVNFDHTLKKKNSKDNLDFQSNKRNVINSFQSDIEFKKPYKPVQDEIYKNINKISSKTVQPSMITKVFYLISMIKTILRLTGVL